MRIDSKYTLYRKVYDRPIIEFDRNAMKKLYIGKLLVAVSFYTSYICVPYIGVMYFNLQLYNISENKLVTYLVSET